METRTPAINYRAMPDQAVINKVSSSLLLRGITTHYTGNKEGALALLKELIPAGAEVMTGSSVTLKETGFTDYLKSGQHPWKNIKQDITNEKDKTKRSDLRKKSVLSEYFVNSVHAVTEIGQLLVASATGSQLPSIAYTSRHVILVVGTHKIVPSLEAGLKRIHEYCFPLEDKQMKAIGKDGSSVSRILVFEREISPNRKIELIFVNEALGF